MLDLGATVVGPLLGNVAASLSSSDFRGYLRAQSYLSHSRSTNRKTP
jgi:hypothetical protein